MNEYYVYILASKRNGTLYIGVTNDLIRRVHEHRTDKVDGFTKQHTIHRLVYYEPCGDVREAIAREKQLKDWHRQWKIELIQQANPAREDLYDELIGAMDCGSSPQ